MGSQVLGSGGLNISGLHGDNGAIGVGNQTSGEGITVVSDGVDGTSSSSMGDLGGVNLSSVSGDDGSVGMSDQGPGNSDSVGVRVGVASIGHRVHQTTSSSVGQLGSGNLGGVSGNLSSVGVGDQGLGRASGDNSGENLKELIGISSD